MLKLHYTQKIDFPVDQMLSQHFCLQVPNKNNVHSYIHVYLIVLLLITIIKFIVALVARVSVGLGISFRCFAGEGKWGESQKEKGGGGEGKALTNFPPPPPTHTHTPFLFSPSDKTSKIPLLGLSLLLDQTKADDVFHRI